MDNNYGERKVLLSIKVSTLVVLFVVATVLLVTAAILGNISKDNTKDITDARTKSPGMPDPLLL